MGKLYLRMFAVLLCLSLMATTGRATVIENYSYNFDSSWGPTYSSYYQYYKSHDIAPAGWGHLANGVESSYSDPTYPEYYFRATDGVGGSGCLQVGSQKLMDDETYSYRTVYDLLVTPKVSGKITIQAKLSSTGSSTGVRFFKVTNSNGKWVRGDEITPSVNPSLSTSEYKTIELDGLSDEYIGIRVSEAYVDNFTAESANIEDRRSMKIDDVKANMTSPYNCDENGSFKLSFTANVSNSGTVDLTPGSYGVSIVTINGTDTTALATVNGEKTLKSGDADILDISATISYKDYPSSEGYKFYVRENVTNSVSSGTNVVLVPHEPTCDIVDSSYPYGPIDSLDFDYTQTMAQQRVRIKNNGGSTLKFNSIDLPQGFSIDEIDSIKAGGDATPYITLCDSVTPGRKEGLITFHTNAGDSTLYVSGTTVSKDVWFTNFGSDYQSSGIPVNMTAGSWKSTYFNVKGNSYRANAATTRSKLITPKLHFDKDGKLSYQAGRDYGSGAELVVYYSADKNGGQWTRLDSVESFSNEKYSGSSSDYKMTEHNVTLPEGDWYVAFDGKAVYVDNIYGGTLVDIPHDMAIDTKDVPAAAVVNNEYTATVALSNHNIKSETAANYKVKLYVGGKAVAEAQPVDIASGKIVTFKLAFTPHDMGTFPAYVKAEWTDGYELVTDTTSLIISQETAGRMLTLGTPTTNGASNGPVKDYYKNCETVSNFSASEIDLPAGTKIKKVIYRGKNSSFNKPLNVNLWLNNVADGTALPTGTNAVDRTGAQLYSLSGVQLAEGGSTSAAPYDASKSVDLLTFDMTSNPFVYNGGTLQISTEETANGYGSSFGFETDANNTDYVYRCSDNDLSAASWKTNASRVVVTIEVESKPSVLSGVVRDEKGKAVEGQPVALISGNVVYADTTDAEGKYSLTVYQDTKTYKLSVLRNGYVPVEQTIKLNGDSTNDISLKVASGFYITSYNIPAKATVNNSLKAFVEAKNVIANAIAAGDYTATLYVDGNAVASAKTQDVAAGDTAKLAFEYYPHAAGTYPAFIKIVKGADEYVTDTVDVVMEAEFAGGEKVVGTYNDDQGEAIVKRYYNYDTTHMIYPKDKLDLQNGAKILSLEFKSNSKNKGYQVTVYLDNTTDDYSNGFVDYDLTDKTPVFSGTVDGDNFKMELSEPFVYTGNNLRVVTLVKAPNGYTSDNFEVDKTMTNNTYFKYSDSEQPVITSANVSEVSNKATYTPVMYLTIATSKTFSVTVTGSKDNAPVAGATVTLTSEDGHAVYTGTTDADGKADISVAQPDKAYNYTVVAQGYNEKTGNFSFSSGDTYNEAVALDETTATGITSVTGGKEVEESTAVYDLSGRYVGRFGDKASLPKGVYIVGGKKVVMK